MSFRSRAFLWHLSISAAIGLCSLILVFFVWYPDPLHKAVGVTEIFLAVLTIVVVLGPCLTWIAANPNPKRRFLASSGDNIPFYDVEWGRHQPEKKAAQSGKKQPILILSGVSSYPGFRGFHQHMDDPDERRRRLILDLLIIIGIQCCALVFGLSTVAEGRPSWLVLNADRVDLVRASEIDTRHLDKAMPEYRHVPWGHPQWVLAEMPTDVKESNTLTRESGRGGPDLFQRPEYFRPITDPARMPIIRDKAQPFEKLEKFNPPEDVAAQLIRYPEADAWMPIRCNVQSMVVLLNKESGKILGIVDLNPWE